MPRRRKPAPDNNLFAEQKAPRLKWLQIGNPLFESKRELPIEKHAKKKKDSE